MFECYYLILIILYISYLFVLSILYICVVYFIIKTIKSNLKLVERPLAGSCETYGETLSLSELILIRTSG